MLSLRKQVERLLPGWESWYPSLFDAAHDLGLIRARVCPPSSLLLSNRHSGIKDAAVRAHREKWGGLDEHPQTPTRTKKRSQRRDKRKLNFRTGVPEIDEA